MISRNLVVGTNDFFSWAKCCNQLESIENLCPSPSESLSSASVSFRGWCVSFVLVLRPSAIEQRQEVFLKRLEGIYLTAGQQCRNHFKLGVFRCRPTRVTQPRSTTSKRENLAGSCWTLWISSMKMMGLRAVKRPCSRLDFYNTPNFLDSTTDSTKRESGLFGNDVSCSLSGARRPPEDERRVNSLSICMRRAPSQTRWDWDIIGQGV